MLIHVSGYWVLGGGVVVWGLRSLGVSGEYDLWGGLELAGCGHQGEENWRQDRIFMEDLVGVGRIYGLVTDGRVKNDIFHMY